MVDHDLREFDTVGPQTLGENRVDGVTICAVMQPSKTGLLGVFDRATGKPVWPIEERPVPQSEVRGEHSSATQPFPTKPPSFARHEIRADDFIDFPGFAEPARAVADSFVVGPIFTPPSLVIPGPGGEKGTLALPGSWGAGNWNTGAFDPETGTHFPFAHAIPRAHRIAVATAPGVEMVYWSANREAPYLDGIPGAGSRRWASPAGRRRSSRGRSPSWPTVQTSSGACSRTCGAGDRVYDKRTGEVVWETELPAGTTGAPMTCVHEDRQYIVVPVGGREDPPEWVALALS